MKAAFFTDTPSNVDYVYAKGRREQVAGITELYPEIITDANFEQHLPALHDLDVIFSTWGMFPLTEKQLDGLPALKAVFYGAGATDHFARVFLQRGIKVISAWQANAIPVAEFATAQILLSLKGFFRNTREFKSREKWTRATEGAFVGPGVFEEKVALIGAGAIAQKTRELLARHDIEVIVIPSRQEKRTISLEEAFKTAFVISNHLPNREDNQGVIKGRHFRLMRPGAVFINTGRGAQVDETEMIAVLKERPDLTVLLDVTWPEPPETDSDLYRLPNVHLSSHIAGSIGNEVVRMADFVIADYQRFVAGEPLQYEVTESMLMTS